MCSVYSGMSLAELKSVTKSRLNRNTVYVYLKSMGSSPSYNSNNTQCGNNDYLCEYEYSPGFPACNQFYAPPHTRSSMSLDTRCVSTSCTHMDGFRSPARFPYHN